jgi:hypothetical protein
VTGRPDVPGGTHAVRAKVTCNHGHLHDTCIPLRREVHPDLRCLPTEPQGYSVGGGGACTLPPDLDQLAERELRGNLQESRRRGWLLIA